MGIPSRRYIRTASTRIELPPTSVVQKMGGSSNRMGQVMMWRALQQLLGLQRPIKRLTSGRENAPTRDLREYATY